MDIVERQQRLLGRVRVGRLRVVDEQHPAKPPNLFHAVGEPRKRLEGARDALALDAQRPRGGVGERGVLRVVGAAKRARLREIDCRRRLRPRHYATLFDPYVSKRRRVPGHRDNPGRAGARLQARIDFPARLVIDADERDLGLRDEPLLDRRIADEIAMPVEMVRRDVDQESDARRERGRKVDLIGRTLDDVRAPGCGRRQVENWHADVAAHRHLAPGFFQHMRDQRGGRRFAVRAGDRDERRIRRPDAAFAREELDIADDRNPRCIRKVDRPMRGRVGQRHARREHEQLEAAPIGPREIDQRKACGGSAFSGGGAVVPSRHLGAARNQRPRGRQSRAAETEEGDALTAHGLDRRHAHLSFNEARPIIARTKAMIQNRMTICGSDQPSCSK